jgi:hypothetical protein
MKPRLKTKRPFDYKKLTALLEPQGFWLQDHPDRVGYTHTGAAVWFRGPHPDGIYDEIICGAGTWAMVNGGIQVVPGATAMNGLHERFYALELTIKHPTPENMLGWEERVARIAPIKCDEIHTQAGPALLASTRGYHASALKYLKLCRGHENVESLHQHLQTLGEVPKKWLFEAVPFTFIPGANKCFISAALLLYWFAHEAESPATDYRSVNCANESLRCITNILASRLANERGWPRTWQEEAANP